MLWVLRGQKRLSAAGPSMEKHQAVMDQGLAKGLSEKREQRHSGDGDLREQSGRLWFQKWPQQRLPSHIFLVCACDIAPIERRGPHKMHQGVRAGSWIY